MVELSPVFIHFLTEAMEQIPLQKISRQNHVCCQRNFTTKQEDDEFQKKLEAIEDKEGLCTCNVMDLTLQSNHLLEKDQRKIVYEFYFKMFQSFKFKQILGLSFVANISTLTSERKFEEADIMSIGVQVLTVDDIALTIMKN